jgi:hypothetical protein
MYHIVSSIDIFREKTRIHLCGNAWKVEWKRQYLSIICDFYNPAQCLRPFNVGTRQADIAFGFAGKFGCV